MIIFAFKVFIDKGCCCKKRKTAKKDFETYFNLYLGPEFLIETRYA